MNTKHLIAPSVLSADFTRLAEDIDFINKSDADWFHVDVMDGSFVPNISFGFDIIRQMKRLAMKPLDVHLMIVEPEKYIERFREAGADVITVHYEACPHLHRTIQQIKATGAKAGVALNPHTPVSVLEDCIQELDLVCIMSVNPGFGGQSFIENTYKKVKQLKSMILEQNASTMIEIDGGVSTKNAAQLLAAGADVLVAGSGIFKSEDRFSTTTELKNISLKNLNA